MPNQHYYSSVPDELGVVDKLARKKAAPQKELVAFKRPPRPLPPPLSSPSTMSITIKMGPRRPKPNLQMNLSDLNKLTKKSREVASEDITSTASNSSLNMAQFRKTKDFGDFQILTNSPDKGHKAPAMVDV